MEASVGTIVGGGYNLHMLHDGFFDLRSPVDLLDKMRRDFKRLRAAPKDTYAAFDFFVTASHMHEWLNGSGCAWSAPTEPRDATVFKLWASSATAPNTS